MHSRVAFGTGSCTPQRGCKNLPRLQPGTEIWIPGFVFFTLFFFSIFSAVTLQLAHGAEVLQVSDVLLLVAIFIS